MSFDVGVILAAVRDRLKLQVTDLGGRVFVVADEDLLPAEAPFPSAAVRDAGTDFVDLDNQDVFASHAVVVSLFQQNLRDVEAPILGDTAGAAGIEDLVDDAITALKDQTLGLSVLEIVRPQSVTGTELFLRVNDGVEIVRKSITWVYRQKPSI